MIRNLDRMLRESQDDIKALKGIVKSLKMSEELEKFVSTFDIHKICEIDAALDRLRESGKTTANELAELKKLVEKINSLRMG